jgi:endonuclease G
MSLTRPGRLFIWNNIIITLLVCLFVSPAWAHLGDENIAMGNPSNATSDLQKTDNYLIRKKDYVFSYNKSTCNPNWVSWHLNQSWIGTAKRKDDFRPDENLPKEWMHVKPRDYAKSGFDKGHMCNSKDRTKDAESNSATFLMSNMVPQSPKNNEHTWEQMEEYCRTLASKGNELYIVCGPYGKGGEGKTTKGKLVKKDYLTAVRTGGKGGKIVVPAKTWKVVLVLPHGTTFPNNVSAAAETIAVIMPNNEEIDLDWTKYISTVSEVETLTGYRFFSEIDPAVAHTIKAHKYSISR